MINILVIENNNSILIGYKQIIKDFFSTTVKCDFVENLAAGLSKIKDLNGNYSGAIVDLRLDATETDGAGGNEIIRAIKSNLRFPICVLSGHIEDLELDLKPSQPSPLFRCLDKGSPEGQFQTVIEEIIKVNNDLNSTGIFNILSRKGQIEQYISEIFYTHVSKSLDYWKSKPSEKALLRYTLSHLQEYLELGEHGDLEPYHPVEFFIDPPIKIHATKFCIKLHQKKNTSFSNQE